MGRGADEQTGLSHLALKFAKGEAPHTFLDQLFRQRRCRKLDLLLLAVGDGKQCQGAEDVTVAPCNRLRECGLQLVNGGPLARPAQALQHQHAARLRCRTELADDFRRDSIGRPEELAA